MSQQGQTCNKDIEYFYTWVKRHLEYESEFFQFKELGSIIDDVIKRVCGEILSKESKGKLARRPPGIIVAKIKVRSYEELEHIEEKINEKCEKVREKIRRYGSIFIVGAGVSFESEMPLSKELDELLKFCDAKNFNDLRRNSEKCRCFKEAFKELCERKSPSKSHKLIVKNFPKYILEIICLNWDNMLEKAAKELGVSLPKINVDDESRVTGKRYLWKFHGDVELIIDHNKPGKGGWIFPKKKGKGKGYVFKCFRKYLEKTGLKKSPVILVVVGYSEKDEEIYNEIIKLFEEKKLVVRIGLDLDKINEKDYIVGTAGFVLERLLPVKDC